MTQDNLEALGVAIAAMSLALQIAEFVEMEERKRHNRKRKRRHKKPRCRRRKKDKRH